jgi:Protein of unknown function (DUF3352)
MRGLRTPLAAICVAAATALGLAACGGGDSSEGPAGAVPADAPVYFESAVNLEQADGLTDALETLGVEDPAGMFAEELDAEAADDDSPVNYSDDIEPLLGERGGFFVSSFGSGGDLVSATTDCVAPEGVPTGTTDDGCAIPTQEVGDDGDGALVVETTDEDGARDLIDELIAEGGDPVEDASHGDVDYKLNPEDGDAVAVFDGFVVLGTEPAIQAAIDASAGDSLADSEEYQAELDALDSDPVFTAYADPAEVLDQLEASGELDPAERGVAEQAIGGLGDVPAVLTIGAEPDRLTLDASAGVAETAAQLPVEESELLRALPGDSWAATAIPDVGASIEQALSQITATAGPAAPDFGQELRRETGLDLEALTGAIGDVALFVRDTSPLDAGGGAVVEDLDPAATADAIEVLRRLALREAGPGERVTQPSVEGEGFAVTSPDLPQPINVIQRDDKLVVAYGDDATEDALAPSETLGDSETFGTATDALGDYGVSLFLDVGPALDLAEASGATADPEYAEAAPYLEHLDYLITGGSVDDDRSRVRAVLGLTE